MLVVLAAMVIAASLISIPYYAITPGTAQPVAKLIGVPKAVDHHHKGQVLLVDVELTPLKAIEWPWFKLNGNADIVPSQDLLGPETAKQYNTEGVLDMSRAQQAATVVALKQLGYPVKVRTNGALIYAVLPASPAEKYLGVGDVVTKVNHTSVSTAAELGAALRHYGPGDTISLEVRVYPSKKTTKSIPLQLSAWRIKGTGQNATLVCPLYGSASPYPIDHVSPETGKHVSSAPCIGALNVETSYATSKLPFKVDLSSEGIIGPSAGLSFTLGLMQRLDPYDLTGGHKVAATGTMSITGAVGAIGGVAQKTVAVERAGASYFFVPKANYAVAHAHADKSLHVYGVTSLHEVVMILKRLGGRLPAKSGTP